MDSLTQIVLGAACGEAVLGKKIGNKALLFGAIGGTIPDLDVIVGGWWYANEIDAMLFHRGIMHSILFSIIAALGLGLLSFKCYNTKKRVGLTTRNEWLWLWFLALFTHPILDCFTPYGTQLFAPFSNYHVAFNNIAVADPLYTIPFLVCMLIVMCYKRSHLKRRLWLKLGVGLSSFYMLCTLCNKYYVNRVFKETLEAQNIPYTRYTFQPTLLNNLLWYGVAETETAYYAADYSLLDATPKFKEVAKLPKQRDLTGEDFKAITDLALFSNNYYTVYKTGENRYRYNDLRYPLLNKNKPDTSVFSLELYETNGVLDMMPFEPKIEDFNTVWHELWQRIKGIE